MFAGLVIMVAALEPGAGAGVTTWPMLLAGIGIGALASQLGSITVSAVPDEQSGEVGGLQNTITNLGISIGTALTGAIVIAALSSSFLSGVEGNPAVPAPVKAQAIDPARGRGPVRLRRGTGTALDEDDVPRTGDRRDRRRKRNGADGRPAQRARRAGAPGPRRPLLDRPDTDEPAGFETERGAGSAGLRRRRAARAQAARCSPSDSKARHIAA